MKAGDKAIIVRNSENCFEIGEEVTYEGEGTRFTNGRNTETLNADEYEQVILLSSNVSGRNRIAENVLYALCGNAGHCTVKETNLVELAFKQADAFIKYREKNTKTEK
jgi:hypothetical protein